MEADEAQPPEPGASTAVVLLVMIAIAVVTAGSVVAWARLAAPGREASRTGLAEELPESLADGRPFAEVPAAVAEAVEAPVVGALRLEAVPDGLDGCEDIGFPLENRRLESAFVTGDALTLSFLGESQDFAMVMEDRAAAPMPPEQPGTARMTCSATWENGWHPQGGGGSIAPADDAGFGSGVGSTCCTADGRATATATVAVPEDTDWLVQDRGAYRLAYPVAGLEAMALSWQYRQGPFRPGPPSTTITLLDDAGQVLEERVLGF